MGSSRFFGKVMRPILGKPLIAYHFERLLKAALPIFLATTDGAEDDVLAKCAAEYGITVYRGDRDDVLSRYFSIAQQFDLKVIIRVTADCPLVDGLLIKKALDQYACISNENLYLSPCLKRTLPRGLDFEIFSHRLLERAHRDGHRKIDREHVTPHLYHPPLAQVKLGHVVEEIDLSTWRLCVDKKRDICLIEKLIGEHRADQLFGKQLLQLLIKVPHLKAINQDIQQIDLQT